MKKKTIGWIIALMSVSLAGIIAVQLQWIQNAVEVKTEQFNNSVNDALNMVVSKLEKNENLFMISENIDSFGTAFHINTVNLDSVRRIRLSVTDTLKRRIKHLDVSGAKVEWIEDEINQNYQIYTSLDSAENVFSYRYVVPGNNKLVEFAEPDHIYVDSEQEMFDPIDEDVWILDKDDTAGLVMSGEFSRMTTRVENLNEIIQQIVFETWTLDAPITSRIKEAHLQSHIKKSLGEQGIRIPFEYAVVSGGDKGLIPVSSEGFNLDEIDTEFRVSLFPNDVFSTPNFLLLSFPDRNMHVLRSLWLLLMGSLVFTLIILITFSVTIWVILKQKKLSGIKSDFINNMTHEFKTPIATISLAVDSINNPKILSEPDRIKYFTGVIRDENRRMNTQVENVLQMALIDKRDFKLQVREINVHEIINRAVKHIRLQVDRKQGEIILELDAGDPIIENDEIHFFNIINNLLDNAIKYSKERPSIKVASENTQGGIKISVEDNGIGIGKEAQQKIFDKFFRVASGDIHNIKGFGLGLSYVKALVLAFKGDIKLYSEPGKGSRFDIYLPNKNQ